MRACACTVHDACRRAHLFQAALRIKATSAALHAQQGRHKAQQGGQSHGHRGAAHAVH